VQRLLIRKILVFGGNICTRQEQKERERERGRERERETEEESTANRVAHMAQGTGCSTKVGGMAWIHVKGEGGGRGGRAGGGKGREAVAMVVVVVGGKQRVSRRAKNRLTEGGGREGGRERGEWRERERERERESERERERIVPLHWSIVGRLVAEQMAEVQRELRHVARQSGALPQRHRSTAFHAKHAREQIGRKHLSRKQLWTRVRPEREREKERERERGVGVAASRVKRGGEMGKEKRRGKKDKRNGKARRKEEK
jgi:hypothetical protein